MYYNVQLYIRQMYIKLNKIYKKNMATTFIEKTRSEFKDRLEAVKHRLPSNWRQVIIANYPEYESVKNYSKLTSVYAGRSSHLEIIELMERVANGELSIK